LLSNDIDKDETAITCIRHGEREMGIQEFCLKTKGNRTLVEAERQ